MSGKNESSGPKDEGALSKYLKPFANPFASGDVRAKVLNANESSTPWNIARQAEAKKEMTPEIKATVGLVRESIAKTILGIKNVVKMPLKIANEIVTNVIALPINLGRWALDIVRLPPRLLAVVTDQLAEKTFGKASKAIADVRKGVHSRIDKIDGLSFKGLFKGGHGGKTAAAH
ncbi:hypothetical protein M0P48_02235 [Candidatus Gracilibacteria bacterium]|jgi:hypothetical protein|nr:hypothetical protein [Candidatus Gracilibacteria bacterium]